MKDKQFPAEVAVSNRNSFGLVGWMQASLRCVLYIWVTGVWYIYNMYEYGNHPSIHTLKSTKISKYVICVVTNI